MAQRKSLKEILSEHVEFPVIEETEDCKKPGQPALAASDASRRSAVEGNTIVDSSCHSNGGCQPSAFASSPSVSTCASLEPELSNLVYSPTGSVVESPSESPMSLTNGDDRTCTPVQVAPPPGLSMQWTPDEPAFLPHPSFTSKKEQYPEDGQQLERAAELLNAAVKNWKACAQWEAPHNSAEVKEAEQRMLTANALKVAMTVAPATRAAPFNEEKPATLLQNGPHHVSGSLPTNINYAVHELIQQEGGDIQEENKRKWAVRRLREQLEKQQEESARKIMVMMQAQMAGGAATQPMLRPMDAWQMPGAAMRHPMGMMPFLPWTSEEGVWGHTFPRGDFAHQARAQPGLDEYGGFSRGKGRNGRRNNRVAALPAGDDVSLSKHLRELEKVDPDRVVLVRKINQLGLDSPALLEAHYSQYGNVERVLVAHSKYKVLGSAIKFRPSGLGFVVMSKKEEASAILSQGTDQLVNGGPDQPTIKIRVQPFQHYSATVEDIDSPAAGN